MKQHWKRLLIAACMSSSVFGATVLWYEYTKTHSSQHHNTAPLAYIEKIKDDLQKRAPTKLLWQTADKGDALYDGEAIRTSSQGEARIVFADSESYLDLEPDSLIVLKKFDGEIALDLLEGHLFVKAQDNSNIVLNSQEGKVQLNQASASISKRKGKALDLQMIAGQALVQNSSGQKQSIVAKTELRILTPNLEKELIISADSPEPLKFEWQAVPQGVQYKFISGLTRESLEMSINTSQTSLSLNLSEGHLYWKVEAYDAQGRQLTQTPIYRSNILARHTPLVTYPSPDAQIVSPQENDGPLTFKWQTSPDINLVKIEIYQEEELKNLAAVKSFTTEESHTFENLPVGNYYWRIVATYNDSDLEIASQVHKLSLLSNLESQPLNIAVNPDKLTQVFDPKIPAQITWSADRLERAHTWKVELHPEDNPTQAIAQLETQKPEIRTALPKAGRYLASISAYNSQGQPIGQKNEYITLTEKPLLNPPALLPEAGELQADPDGQTTLTWAPVKEAKAYIVLVKRDDKVLSDKVYYKNEARFKNLLPGEYQIQVLSIDQQERRGPASLPRPLVVPATSNLKAPSLKKVKVN